MAGFTTTSYVKGTTREGLGYRVRGTGDPLLLLSGYATRARALEPAAAVFAEHFQVITFDYRGTGRSRRTRGQVTTGGMARDAARVLKHLDVAPAHVYGLSLGGMVAQELAIQSPEVVRSLVLGATTPGGWDAVPAGPWTILATYNQRRGVVPGALTSRGLVDLLHAWAASTHDTSTRLKRIQAPTLVVHGDRDLLVPPRNAELLAAGIPGAELKFLPGRGHMYMFEDPESSARTVIDWLSGLSADLGRAEARPRTFVSEVEGACRHALTQFLPWRHTTRALCPVLRG